MRTLSAQPLDRAQLLARLRDKEPWDAVIIGGGATGLGIALDAAARGLRVALVEQRDFASGTSSRSTKLIHGGVRYLAQANVKLVREALAERAVLHTLAPEIVRPIEFIVPCYRFGERAFMRAGLGLYDLLAGRASLGPTRWLTRRDTLERLPGVRAGGLLGGVSYWDAQFDDAAMAIALMQTACALGATAVNYLECTALDSAGGRIEAVRLRDAETGEHFRLRARCVFNAAGVWVDAIRRQADAGLMPVTTVSQGSHIVIDRCFMPAGAAMLIPRTRDARVLFVVPWYGALLVGTTDVARADAPLEPAVDPAEEAFLLRTAGDYLAAAPQPRDVRARFSGLRPLLSTLGVNATARLSREHAVLIEAGNLVSIVGGKWTTYRRMAQDAIDAAQRAGLLHSSCASVTAQVRLIPPPFLSADAAGFRARIADEAFIDWSRRFTQARTLDDIRSRRARLEFIDQSRPTSAMPSGAR
jgi:glycerol-3-phosphate dehydrogenase